MRSAISVVVNLRRKRAARSRSPRLVKRWRWAAGLGGGDFLGMPQILVKMVIFD
jgi:hypothetical protein